MINFKGTVVSALLVGASIASQPALADYGINAGEKAKVIKFEYADVIDVKISSNSGSGWRTVKAGEYQGLWANGDSFTAFCVEISQNLAGWGKLTSYTDGSSVYGKFTNDLTSLANKYYSLVDDAVSSAAFQIAIWEVVTETKKGLSLDKGTFQADNTTTTTKEWVPGSGSYWNYKPGHYNSVTVDDPESLAAINLAKTWLAGINDDSVLATGDYSLQYLKNGQYQDLVVFTQIAAVPEPATYGMLLLGMGVVAFVTRRRRTNTLRF